VEILGTGGWGLCWESFPLSVVVGVVVVVVVDYGAAQPGRELSKKYKETIYYIQAKQ
jgi:hypothetical protein